MREITTFLTLFLLLAGNTAREYQPCDLLSELMEKYNLPLEDSIGMTCVAASVSELKTTHAQTDILSNRRVFGMFGISEGNACKFGHPGFCSVTCDKFLDNDITDDLDCLRKILDYTPRRPKAFTDCETYDWKYFMEKCSTDIKRVTTRNALDSKYFRLHDFDLVKRDIESQLPETSPIPTIMRPGPPADIDAIKKNFVRQLEKEKENSPVPSPNYSKFEHGYVTDEPPRPFSKSKPRRRSSSENGARKQRRKKPKQLNLNIPGARQPLLPSEFHVIPGPSVSVPLSNLIGKQIPDVPIDPPPSLSRGPTINTASREYLPPIGGAAGPGGHTKKFDIKLDRPVSQITVHVTYA